MQLEASEKEAKVRHGFQSLDDWNWQRLSSVHLRNADRGSCYYAPLLIYHQVDVCHSIVVDFGGSSEGMKVRAQETKHDSCI